MATDYMAGFDALLKGVTAPVGTGAGKPPVKDVETKPVVDKPKYTIDPSIPENIRKIIEQSENSGTPIPDKIDGGEVQTSKPKSFVDEMMETLGKGAGALAGSLGKGAAGVGGAAGSAAGAVADKLGAIWIRWIIIVVGVVVLALGLFMFSNQAVGKAGTVVLNSGVGKAATKLLPAGKAVSIAKGLL